MRKNSALAVLAACMVLPAAGQDLKFLLDELNSVEKKLAGIIEREVLQRKAADNTIMDKLGKGQAARTGAVDSGLASSVSDLKKDIDGCKNVRDSVVAAVARLSGRVDSIAKAPPDSSVAEMAEMLRTLTADLKKVIEKTAPASGQSKADEKEAMSVGGLVTVDYASPTDDFSGQSLTVGRIELRAVVNVNPNVKGFITLLSEGDLHKIRIYQAAADLTLNSSPLEMIIGQQIFNHGLMTTRLINYPLGYGYVLPNQPGATAQYAACGFKLGIAGLMTEAPGLTVTHRVVSTSGDTISIAGGETPGARSGGGIVSADFGFAENSNAHVSSLLSENITDIDLACTYSIGKLTVDAEYYSQLKMSGGAGKTSTYCAGISYAVTDIVSVAARHDGLSINRFKDKTMLYAGGIVVKIFGDCYGAFEYDHLRTPEGAASSLIAVEFGLQSTLKLPGFQRKSLTNQ